MNPTESKIPDIKDILAPDPLSNLWPWIIGIGAGLLVLGLLVWLMVFFVLKDRNRPMRTRTPREIALSKLKDLQQKAGDLTPNEFSLQVSEVLKDFLSERYSDPFRYETSEEFLERISISTEGNLPASKREKLAGFIGICDEIKFGRPPDAESRKPDLLTQARGLVEHSEPIPAS